MGRTVYLADAIKDASEKEVEQFLSAMRKRRTLYWVLTIIPFVNFVFGSFLIWTRNTIRVIESNGHKEPGGFVNLLIVLWSGIFPVLIMNAVLKGLGEHVQNKILGVSSLLKEYHY